MELRLAALGVGWYATRPFPGYTGRPARASAGSGAFFAGRIVPSFVEMAEAVLCGGRAAPRPLMRWIAAATLGGRFGTPNVPLDAVAQLGPPSRPAPNALGDGAPASPALPPG
jgi:hypothetical protein